MNKPEELEDSARVVKVNKPEELEDSARAVKEDCVKQDEVGKLLSVETQGGLEVGCELDFLDKNS